MTTSAILYSSSTITSSTIESSNISILDTFREYSSDSEPSLDSDYSTVGESEDQSEGRIGVVTGPIQRQYDKTANMWFEEQVPRPATLPCTRQTMRRDNRFKK